MSRVQLRNLLRHALPTVPNEIGRKHPHILYEGDCEDHEDIADYTHEHFTLRGVVIA